MVLLMINDKTKLLRVHNFILNNFPNIVSQGQEITLI